MIVAPTQSDVFTPLRAFLLDVLPEGVDVVQAQDNRVPEPTAPDFVTMTPLRRPRLGTNVDTAVDAKFTGSIAGPTMTITDVLSGAMNDGATVFGIGVAANTTVVTQLTGSPLGGVGTYTVSPPQTIGPITLSAGQIDIEQSTEVVMQLDVHGPDSADNVQIISTLFRDGYAVHQFLGTGVSPLYADDPRQMPFIDAEQQYEQRWTIDLHMQVDPVISVPIEFADAVDLTIETITGNTVVETDVGTIPAP